MNSFHLKGPTIARTWISLLDIELQKRREWEESFRSSGGCQSNKKFTTSTSENELKQYLEKRSKLIELVRKDLKEFLAGFMKQHIIVLIDASGVVLDIHTNEAMMQKVKKYNLPGIRLDMKSAGINAFTVSKEMDKTAVIKGKEHSMELLFKYTSVCTPIRIDQKTEAYLGFVIASHEDTAFAVAIVEQLARQFQKSSEPNSTVRTLGEVEEDLKSFGLSKREIEVAVRWIYNQTTSQIASSLYITEGTIRNMIKKIYKKTNVNGRTQFISKFLIRKTLEFRKE